MARMARIKVDGEAAAYHVHGRIASFKGDYALSSCWRSLSGPIFITILCH